MNKHLKYRPRIIPCMLLSHRRFVKTIRFKNPVYLGDPINIVHIFNEKEVDEIVVLDIDATRDGQEPDYDFIQNIAEECFMPLAYGGGISKIEQIEKLFKIGIEKVIINTAANNNSELITHAVEKFGSQSVLVSIDVMPDKDGNYRVFIKSGTIDTGYQVLDYAKKMESLGVGEILLNSINKDGTMEGYDIKLISLVSSAVKVPVIACGGAGSLEDIINAVKIGGASAAAAGSLFVFHGSLRGVLIWYPSRNQLDEIFRK